MHNCNNKPNNNCHNNKIQRIFYVGTPGPAGPAGLTPTLQIGEVTTGAPGSEASASITGEAPNYVLNLTIPQGPASPVEVK